MPNIARRFGRVTACIAAIAASALLALSCRQLAGYGGEVVLDPQASDGTGDTGQPPSEAAADPSESSNVDIEMDAVGVPAADSPNDAVLDAIDAGYDGGTDATTEAAIGPVADSAMDARTDVASETGADAGIGDADGGVADAGLDAPRGNDANETGTWCAAHKSPNTIVCHDFDEGKAAQAGFGSNYFTSIFASVTTTDFAPESPPGALLLATPLLEAGAPFVEEQFNDTFAFHNKVDLSFALKIVDYDPNSGYFSLFRFSYNNVAWAMEYVLQGTGANVVESTPLPEGGSLRSTYWAAQPSPLTAWTAVDCLFDFVKHTVSVSFNGVVIVSNQTIANPDQNNPTIFVQMGLNFLASPAKPMEIYYDDILISAPP